jgi:hypothetical protein
MEWSRQLKYDPVAPLIASGNPAIQYFVRRDLLQETVGPISSLWTLKPPQYLLHKQLPDGSWVYPNKSRDHCLLQTFKNLQILVYQYGFTRDDPAVAAASEYILSYQTDEGDIRGFIGNQYAPYYTGIVLALLIQAGCENAPRLEKGFNWLLTMRQNDGGWVIGSPGLLGLPGLSRDTWVYLTSDPHAETARSFDWAQPFSHSGTGMVLRAFASHNHHRYSPAALQAARLLKSHFFQADNYSSYQHPDHWVRFSFPFWWNNLLASLDSLSLIGLPASDPDIQRALQWFVSHQSDSGLWQVSYSSIHKSTVNRNTSDQMLWITLSICRVFQRLTV